MKDGQAALALTPHRLRRSLYVAALGVILVLVLTITSSASAHPTTPPHHNDLPGHANEVMRAFWAQHHEPENLAAITEATTACVDGFAGVYPCSNVDLYSFLPINQIGGTSSNSAANDIWGWTDTASGREFAIIGMVFGTSFVEITDPNNPVYLGEMVTHGAFGSSWRDVKVYNDHAFVVSEANQHGMQVFDLTQLLNVQNPPVTFAETAHYNKNASAHNIAINEDSGYAYIVGAAGKNSCSGGLHMVDISNPTNPSFAGCFSADGYTHDAQCVNYNGPDTDHQGKEICFNSNEDTLTIVDVTDKSNPVQLSRTGYPGAQYTHQGWLTDNQTYFLLDDELDEQNVGHNTRSRVWDVSDLDAPAVTGFFDNSTPSIDHNQYVVGDYSFQANYRSGLRILDISDVANANLSEFGFFDIYPADDNPEFNAAWSNFPYFPSGTVVVSGIEQGLFVLKPNLTPPTTGTVTGTVTDNSTGLALAGASVSADTGQSDTTAADGSYTLNSVPTGNRTITASASGYLTQQQALNVTETGPNVADFALDSEPTGTVTGTVTDNSTGQPIAGASVSADTGESDTTAADGTYTLSDVPAGSRTITASASGYVTQQQATNVTDGGASVVDFALDPEPAGSGTIKGTVRGSNGRGLGGATVVATPDGAGTGGSDTTNNGGKYTINVSTGTFDVAVTSHSCSPATQQVSVSNGETVTLADFNC